MRKLTLYKRLDAEMTRLQRRWAVLLKRKLRVLQAKEK